MELQLQQLMQSFFADDHRTVSCLLGEHPELCQHLNQHAPPPLAVAKSREMIDVLMRNGASIDAVTKWWAPGFGVGQVEPSAAEHLVRLGAKLTIHAAVGIGLIDAVRQMLVQQPQRSCAKGGDGGQPLHFCTDPKIALLLLAHGAEIDARDEDHDSTPVQWRIGDSPEVVRFMLQQGATADIFLAAGLGDLDLAKRLVAENPACTSHRIGNNNGPFPGIGYQDRGGSIYQWTLGFNLSPHEVALRRGHTAVYEFLLENTAPQAKFMVACTSANRPLAEAIAAEYPNMVSMLSEDDLALLAKYCWETNKNINVVRLMLDLGFPVHKRESNHGCTALHNAAWCGDPDLVQLLIERGHPTDVRDPDHDSTPIGWAVHSCLEAKRHPNGRFPEVIELLLAAGTPFEPQHFPVGHDGMDRVIQKHLEKTV